MEGNLLLLFLVFFPIAGALCTYLIGRVHKGYRNLMAIVVTIVEFAVMCRAAFLNGGEIGLPNVCGMGISFTIDGFRGLYGIIAAFMWMMTTIFSKEYFTHYRNRNRYYLFNLLTLGATVGVFLSADLFTTFIFFEIMSFTSYVWVAHDERKEALRAAETYLAVAVTGGMVMLMGLFLLYHALGTLEMSQLLSASAAYENKRILYIAGGCILFGFGAKAGAFPLHIWLPKAHPVAPAPASALLSGILTKSGVFGILVLSCNIFIYDVKWGILLLWIGVLTMFGGALLAIFSVDLKRILACSSMSQIGFILVGIGMQCILLKENMLAVRGSLLHMVNHSLIKLVLFMIAGVVYMNLHKLNLNDIRGFGRKKPLLNLCFLMGALGIGGIPLWNGYISKTLIHESILEGVEKFAIGMNPGMSALLRVFEWVFLISGGMTVAYMTKLYAAIFVEKNSDGELQKKYDAMKGRYMNKLSAFSIAVSAIVLPVMGFLPHLIMDRIADIGQGFMHLEKAEEVVHYFSLMNLRGGIISILIGAFLYVAVVRKLLMKKQSSGVTTYENYWPQWLDIENLLYRPVLLKILPFIFGVICRICDSFADSLAVLLRKTVYRDRKIPHELPEGSYFTHILGCTVERLYRMKCRILRQEAEPISYEHKFAMRREEFLETNMIIGRSLSFGLLLFYVGLVFTLIYLLWSR